MLAREILDFVLSGAKNIEECVKFSPIKTEKFSDYLPDLCDDADCETVTYFGFWSPNEEVDSNRDCLLEYSGDEFVDYELPTSDGVWLIVKIDG